MIQMLGTFAMTEHERELTKRWVQTWKLAGPELERQREVDVRAVVGAGTVEAFDSFYRQALITHPPKPTSGLVEQQAWFQKMRAK
jgi:hypothetical protein